MADVTRIFLPRRGRKSTMMNENKKGTILSEGELFVEVNENGIGKGYGRLKMGDGSTPYEDLPYLLGDSTSTPVEFEEDNSTDLDTALGKVTSGGFLSVIIAALKNGISLLSTKVTDDVGAAIESMTVDLSAVSDKVYNFDASNIKTGTIDIARLPHTAVERLIVVANDTARFALTTDDIQAGDTVKVNDTGILYFVVDDTKLSSADGYVEYKSTHSHTASDVSGDFDFGSED